MKPEMMKVSGFLTKISKNSPTSLGSEMNCESESEHK